MSRTSSWRISGLVVVWISLFALNPSSGSAQQRLSCDQVGSEQFFGCYYNREGFRRLNLTRYDPAIQFNWGEGSPDPAIDPETFSVRWQGDFTFNAGDYRFSARSDDGIRVFVDGKRIISEWHNQPVSEYSAVVSLTGGIHRVRVDYYEHHGQAVAGLSWEPIVSSSQCNDSIDNDHDGLIDYPQDPDCANASDDTEFHSACDQVGSEQFFGCYYNRKGFRRLALTRYDPAIQFNWGEGSPDPSVKPDTFSVRWQGDFTFNAGDYRFTVRSDDGVRVFVDGQRIINEWHDQPASEYSAVVPLAEGAHRVRVDYYESRGQAVASLSWNPESQTAVCGNEVVEGNEICDSSTEACVTSDGYNGERTCLSDCSAMGSCVPDESCGDGTVNGNESCDEGELNGEPGHCRDDCSGTVAVCGNGVVEGNEICDSSAEACVTSDGYNGERTCLSDCSAMGSCVPDESCGDGTVNGSESCDEGELNGEPGHCRDDCSGTVAVCGNGIVEGSEICDSSAEACVTSDGYNGERTCLSDCSAIGSCVPNESCGDGTVNGSESCDEGELNGEPGHCRDDCGGIVAVCGNGIVEGNEICDSSAEACVTSDGYNGERLCLSDCSAMGSCVPNESCGDGTVNGSESCDEGELNGEPGHCRDDCGGIVAVCGNGIVEGNEICDSSAEACVTSDGYNGERLCLSDCSAMGSCVPNESCGDGTVNGNEVCDDGGMNGEFGYCAVDCSGVVVSECGDGIVEGDESCDDGNMNGQDGYCNTECTGTVNGSDPTTLPLVQRSDITYLGSFHVPESDNIGCNWDTGEHCFTYGGVFGFNPLNNSLYMSGHAWAGGVGEVSIPADFSSMATVLQNIADVADGVRFDPGEPNGDGPAFGYVYNDRLIISGSTYYDADYTQTNTHGVSGFDFSVPDDFDGWYRFDPNVVANPRSIGGYMTDIPVEWQALLGGPSLTGNCCLSIISNSSVGPAVSVFDPDNVGTVDPIPGKTLLFYSLDNPLEPEDTQNEYFNLATKMGGVAFPSGTRSVLFVGRQGTGPYCYGEGSDCNDPADGSKGTHAYPYRFQIWAYDANDLLAVKNGTKQPWDPRPYALFLLPEINDSGDGQIAGAAYDPVSRRLYVSEAFGDNPTVHVYQIGTPVPDDQDPVVSLTAPASGGTASGNTTVTASATDNIGVIGVQFMLDGINLESEDTTSPYSITWDTTGAGNGSHTLTAVARDAAGNTDTDSITVTVDNPDIVPVITSHPQDKTVPVGGSATFSVSATGTPPLSYQWTKNGTIISGAVNDIYTTPALSLSDSGSTYSVTVTNSAGSAISHSAVLTVSNSETIWGARTATSFVSDSQPWELGMIFTPTTNGQALGARVYGAPSESGSHSVCLWRNSDGALLSGPHAFTYNGEGWHAFTFPAPVPLAEGTAYTVTVSTGSDSAGWYTAINGDLISGGDNGLHLTYPADAAVYGTTIGVRPVQSYQSANYLRDIIFVSTGGDGTAPAPTASLSASSAAINAGESSTLSWSSTDATSCTGTNFNTDGDPSGSAAVSPVSDTTYTVACTGEGGTDTDSVTVSIIPANQDMVVVTNVPELEAAVSQAYSQGGNLVILLADGTYHLNDTIYIETPNVTLQGQSGNREAVIIEGDAMSASASIGNLIRIAASHVTVRDLTLQKAGWHLIQVAGEEDADNFTALNVHFRDGYQQMLKVSQDPANPDVTSDGGLVENSLFEYTAGIGPQYYIGGIDAHGSRNWVVRGNTFRDIISPSDEVAEHAIHFWDHPSGNNLVENNVIVNCDRGIGFGLGDRGNTGGMIRNNMIYHAAGHGSFADVGIGLETSSGTEVYNNTIYFENGYPNAVEYRFPETTGVVIRNNLANGAVESRDGGSATVNSNVTTADGSWFVNPSQGDLHLANVSAVQANVIDQGAAIAGVPTDIDGTARPQGSGYDIGADEVGDTPSAPACSDGIDNDNDGYADYPADPGCTDANDNNEYNSGGDVIPPVISNVSSSGITENSATIIFNTDEAAGGQVRYGPTSGSLTQVTGYNSILLTSHSILLNGLLADTTYYYEVVSRDAAGNEAVSGERSFMTSAAGSGGGSLDLPLYDTSNIEYLGRFNLPFVEGTIAGGYHEGFRYIRQGGGALAYNPANNSLFVAGGDVNNDGGSTVIAEIAIPTPRTSVPFNTASLVQGFALAAGSIGRQYDVLGGEVSNGATLTGMMVSNGRLLFTVAGLYTQNDQPFTMFVRPSLDLSENTVLGPYKVTNLSNQRIVGNGMGTELPANWQSVFGGYKAIVGGGGNLSTMNTASFGPGFHFFNPDDVQGSTANTVPGVNVCYYADIAASGYPFAPGQGDESDVWNGMSTHRGTIVLPETRTFFAYGAGGSDAFYDAGGVITGQNQGTKATGGTMNDRFYLYDARDLKAAFDGDVNPQNSVRPYGTFDMNFSLSNTDSQWINELDEIRGLTFDPVNRIAYVLEAQGIIHVLKFHISGDGPYACADGLDNDADGLTDYPNDPGCTGPADNDESNTSTPPPTASIVADPAGITSGDSSTLSWSSVNADSCTGTNFSTGNATAGSVSVSPTTDTTYHVSCTGAGGTANDQLTIVVNATQNSANNKERANSYDDAWQDGPDGWAEHAKAILAGGDQVDGLVLWIGDSLTHGTGLRAWAQGGDGKTSEDTAILNWMHAGQSPQGVNSIDGFALTDPYICSHRAYTVGDGLGAWDFMGTEMPTELDQAAAQQILNDCNISSNALNLRTMLAGLPKAQFAIPEVNLDAANPASFPDFENMIDYLISQHVVPIIITYTYRNSDNALFNGWVDEYNAALTQYARDNKLPLIDLNAEMLARLPFSQWQERFLSGDGVHYTNGNAAYPSTADPYADGGDPATHTTGAALTYDGYGLKGWLGVQKMKEIKALVIDPGSTCGNGIVEGDEICDDGDMNGEFGYCRTDCAGIIVAECGNGIVEGGEACDDGDMNGEFGYCNTECTGTVDYPAPTATLSASPTSIPEGGSSTLTWNSTDAENCSGTGFSTAGAVSGSVSVSPVSSTVYVMTCTGAGGTAGDSVTVQVAQAGGGDPTAQALLHQSDLEYLGSFRLPGGQFGMSAGTFEYAGGFTSGNVYNDSAYGKTLFMTGYLSAGYVSETASVAQIQIPDTLADPDEVGPGNLPTAMIVQAFRDPSNGINEQILGSSGSGHVNILPYNGKLIGTTSAAYDGACSQSYSAWVSPLDFSQRSQATGPYAFDSPVGPRWIGGGYMALIPPEWQSLLGGKVVSGNGPWSIISCGSPGPALHVIDADALVAQPAAGTSVNSTPLVYYEDGSHSSLGAWNSNLCGQVINGKEVPCITVTDPHGRGDFSFAYEDNSMRLAGMVFPDGTRSVLFFGSKGMGPYCYGEGFDCNDPDDGSKGDHAYPYTEFVWAYDVNDMLAVKNGTKNPWDVLPYTGWAFRVAGDGNGGDMAGASWDAETRRLYVVVACTTGVCVPTVHVYQVGIPIPDEVPPAVSITAPGDGATVSGEITVSASASDDNVVVGVQFKLDGVDLGGEVVTVPYSVTWDTTQATNSSHTLTAVARDPAGNAAIHSITVTVDNPETPPVITAQPQSTTVSVGSTAAFSVAVAGTPPFVYQWQKNGGNIAGAADSTYTTPALSLSDSGSTYRVMVSNSMGFVTSSSAVLTVLNIETIWGDRTSSSFNSDNQPWDLGMIFTPTVNGEALGARVYGAPNESGDHEVRLWRNSDGTLLSGPHTFTYSGEGWHEFTFPAAVALEANQAYTVTVSTGSDSAGWYTTMLGDLISGGDNGLHLTYPANAAVYSETIGLRPTESYESENYFRDIIFAPGN